jgi:hypothetical protein
VYLDQEAVTKQIGRLEPLSTSAFYRERKRFTSSKGNISRQNSTGCVELTSSLQLDASPLTPSINRHSFSQQIEK